ncbi:DUF3566 domain-containing protein [Cellulomonas triticagri]|uniref:DUF3566 domain-containing protein n=1 Tax=Cellulomonas triticagri TaxID=2483352 RepID=A0A3M2JQ17_9CELL|nr:DUF3566 domain-containing protein [Cellulomonas triticagri]RMI14461.1 hypothetical protein EBM89_00385 [Cellulomonas triticagri]
MSSDTPPSIPPRKSGGSDAPEKPAAGRTATDTGTRAPATAAQPKTGAAARTSAVKTKPAAAPASGTTTGTTPRPASSGTGSSSSTPAAAPTPAAEAPAAGSTTAARPASSGLTTGSGPRRVRLAISRVDPWSVMKLSFLMSVAIGIMIVVATAVVWLALDSLQVFATIEGLVTEILADSDFDLMQYVEFDRVLSVATLVAVVDIVLITALATIGSFLYNITAALVGGIHVTMTDE